MSKSDLRPQEAKEPRTVPLKDVVYWIAILTALVAGLITGWMTHVNQESRVKAEAAAMAQAKVQVPAQPSK